MIDHKRVAPDPNPQPPKLTGHRSGTPRFRGLRPRGPGSRRLWPLLLAAGLVLAAGARAQSPPSFSKAFVPGTIGPGSVSTLRFTITNAGSVPVRNLAFTDALPAGMTIAAPANAAATCAGGSLSAPEGGGTITFSGGGIGAGSSCTVSVDVTSATPGTHTNVSGDLTSDAGNSGNATADLTVATDRPGLIKSFSPASVAFGGRSTLTLTFDNTANPSAAINLAVTDNLPGGMVVADPANATTSCGGAVTAPPGGSSISFGSVVFGDASVAAGATCAVTVDVLGNAVGTLGNTTGELTSAPPSGFPTRSSGKAGAVLTVTPERLSLTKSFTDDPVPPGGTVTLEFTLRNLDRRASATGITFTDDLDAALSGLAAVGLPQADPCGSGSQLIGSGLLTLTGGSLPAGGSCTFSATLEVPADAAAGGYTNTTSQVTADFGGQQVIGNPATDLLFVEAAPALTKSFIDDPAGAGGSVTLEFTITNTSPDATATDIAFEDVFDVILPTASSVPASGFCGAGSTATFIPLGFNPARLVVSGASLAPGASCTFSTTLDVAVDAATGAYPNVTSAVTATVDGESVSGDPASDDLEVVGAPALRKEFIDDPVAPGGTVTLRFTLTHEENAPGDATGITFSDDLDATLSGLVATGLPAGDVCGTGSTLDGTMTLLLTDGSLAPGESCAFDVTLQVPTDAPPGAHTNTTSAVVATVLGVEATAPATSDDLRIAGLTLTKEFTDDPVIPGGTVTLRFTIDNDSPVAAATDIAFTDDLDDALAGLAGTGLPLADPCGTGSALNGTNGDTRLVFTGGSLAPGASCTFDVTLQVPAGAQADTYLNVTSAVSATVEGETVLFGNASDLLTLAADFLALTKEFTDDPVGPGETVTLRFTVTNLNGAEPVTDIAFTDDLDAALTGLASTSGTLTDVCGAGSEIGGVTILGFTGGSLGPGASCTFDVSLQVPATVDLGEVALNTTSAVTGAIGGLGVKGAPASDTLQIDFLTFSKAFDGPVFAGDTVTLTFTIQNLSASDSIQGLAFSDDLDAVLGGLEAIGLPAAGVCGGTSTLAGTSFLTLSGGRLLPGGSCTFSVDLQVPASTPADSYLNVTSDLLQSGIPAAAPATATLTVLEPVTDADGDGVDDVDDVCPGTVIPESVPTRSLKPNRYALVDDDTIFDTVVPPGGGPGDTFTTTDTAGCSCEQIIDALGLGNGHRKFGCSLGAMRNWVQLVGSFRSGALGSR